MYLAIAIEGRIPGKLKAERVLAEFIAAAERYGLTLAGGIGELPASTPESDQAEPAAGDRDE